MTDNKTLIAYVSKGGVTEEAASVIANVLQEKYGFNVDVINLRKNSSPDIAQYSNVIVGCGVRMQKVYKEALNFLEKNDFTNRRVAIFLSSLEPKEEAESKYVKRILEKYPNVKPVATNVFGGRMKILGRTSVDKRDMEKVKSWAEELGKLATEP
jgi:menaquinone-dependent protoporphyrinogen IX oxidase